MRCIWIIPSVIACLISCQFLLGTPIIEEEDLHQQTQNVQQPSKDDEKVPLVDAQNVYTSKNEPDFASTGKGRKSGGGYFRKICRSAASARDCVLARLKHSISAINRLFAKGGPLNLTKFKPKLQNFARRFVELRCGKNKKKEKKKAEDLRKTQNNNNGSAAANDEMCLIVWSILSKDSEQPPNANAAAEGVALSVEETKKLLAVIKQRFPEHFPCDKVKGGEEKQTATIPSELEQPTEKEEEKVKQTAGTSDDGGNPSQQLQKSVDEVEQKPAQKEAMETRDVEQFSLSFFGALRDVPMSELEASLDINRNGKIRTVTVRFLPQMVCALEEHLHSLTENKNQKNEVEQKKTGQKNRRRQQNNKDSGKIFFWFTIIYWTLVFGIFFMVG